MTERKRTVWSGEADRGRERESGRARVRDRQTERKGAVWSGEAQGGCRRGCSTYLTKTKDPEGRLRLRP